MIRKGMPDISAAEVRKRRSAAEAGIDQLLPPQIIKNSASSASLVLPTDVDEKEIKMLLEEAKGEPGPPPIQPFSWTFVIVLTLAAFATRFFKIRAGDFVLWDEAHFGKFASYYLQRKFYFDVHPPLGKMLVALGGYLAGVDKTFEFPSGTAYPEGFNYVGMRMFVAAFGTLVVPFTYLTAIQLRFSKKTSYLCAAMALFENGFIGITRLILLDSMLICFTSWTMLGYSTFRNQGMKPFGLKWWLALVATGFGIGCVSSVKWVGFLVTALVGLLTIEELWGMLGDIKMSKIKFVKHFLARAAGLIAIPVGVYVFSFYIHFLILNESGTGDANMSSLFQAGLQGSKLQSSPVDVIFGSVITMKSNSFGGGLLHSHPQVYPSGSKQQQVTTYHHKDENNEWIMVRSHDAQNEEERKEQNEAIEKIHDKQLIRLRHAKTGRHLHSHQIPAPLTAGDLEVSSYGQEGLYDPNDLWELQIVSDPDVKGKRTLKNLLTKLRLKHVSTGCYLKARNVHLPEWGFKQGEVSCEKTQNPEARYFLWNIETNTNEKLPPGNSSLYKSNFWDNLRDCNVGMWITNNALKPDPELEPSLLTSAPKDWFWMSKGIRMAGWDADKVKFYMLGSPAVWPVSSLAILSLLGLLGAWILLRRRQVYHLVPKNWTFNCYQLKFVTGGWALHYLPFYLLGRVLYLHHYYPALLFAILNAGLLFDLATKNLSPKHQQTATLLAIGGVIGTFLYFSPFCYGMAGPIEAFHGRKWMASWNL